MPAESQPTTPPADRSGRLLSLDVMRGLTILAMILVNNPGTWGAMYWPLGHADWHGWTPTDLIFPFFLFMVGVAMAYSFAKYASAGGRPTAAVWARIARRVALLVLLGLALNASGRLISVPLGYSDAWEWGTLRWPGVLQRIGLAYLGASVVVLTLPPAGRWAVATAIMAAYSACLKLLPAGVEAAERLGEQENIVRRVDLALIGEPHMWSGAVTDPEGLLSTLPAVVTTLIGYAVGRRLKGATVDGALVARLLAAGLAVAAVGIAWDRGPVAGWGMPINKALWTPSFVLLTGGLGMATLAACLAVFDLYGAGVGGVRRVATAFEMVGVNAIFVFVASRSEERR